VDKTIRWGFSGGDPFQSSNGALQQLDQMNYSYGMFGNQGNQMPFNWFIFKKYFRFI
jgi:hypothetical protein